MGRSGCGLREDCGYCGVSNENRRRASVSRCLPRLQSEAIACERYQPRTHRSPLQDGPSQSRLYGSRRVDEEERSEGRGEKDQDFAQHSVRTMRAIERENNQVEQIKMICAACTSSVRPVFFRFPPAYPKPCFLPAQNLRPTGCVAADCDPHRAGRTFSITAAANVSAEACCSSLVFALGRVLHSGLGSQVAAVRCESLHLGLAVWTDRREQRRTMR